LIKVLLDHGLPRSSVGWLRKAGWDTVHVYNIGLSQASDRRILEYARAEERICITLDANFHSLIAVANDIAPSVIRDPSRGTAGSRIGSELVLRIWPRIEAQVRQGALVSVTAKAIRVRLLLIQRDKT
jgi:predicted nuclease of predicted toxin-antitoxin system